MAPLRALASLLALLRAATLCAACELLDPDERLTFTERSISGNWVAQIKLRAWQEGATFSLTFNTNTEITSSEYAVVQRGSPRTTELRLLGRAPFNMLGMEGKGGCWQPSIDKCSAQVTCQMPDSPSPPPAPPVRSPPPPTMHRITPQVVSTTCHSVLLAWTSPLPPDFEVEYLVTTLGSEHAVAQTSQERFDVQELQADTPYQFQISSRIAGEEAWSDPGTVVTGLTKSGTRDPQSLQITAGRSASCTSLRLALPEFGRCTATEYLSVEWRTARSEDWQVVMDRIDVGDLPDNILPIDALDALTRYELRAKLHQAASDGGRVIQGPSTGGLLVDMRSGELRLAPQAKATSSASVHIVLPPLSPCRQAMQIRVLHTNTGQHDGWTPVPPHALTRVDDGFVVDPLRCLVGCQFKLRFPDIAGWSGESEASEAVKTLRLPSVAEGFQRLEVRMTTAATAEAPTAAWGQAFAQAMAEVLSLDAASEVRHVETRGKGRFVIFDLKDSYDGGRDTPSGRLAHLMLGPACRTGTNKALGRPGRVSMSCPSGNGTTSPGLVNDGDLRQHTPFVWRACAEDSAAWWAVEMPEPVTDPLVHLLLGPCCMERSKHEIMVLIGDQDSKAMAKPCARLGNVDDLSSIVAVCKGTGTWLFYSVHSEDSGSTNAPGLSLAEAAVCDPEDATPVFQSPLLRSLDASAGLRELVEDGVIIQVAPELLPGGAAHDAALAKLATVGSGLSLGGAVTLLLLVGIAVLAWRKAGRGCAPPGHSRLAIDERPDVKVPPHADDDEEASFDEEEDEDEQPEGAEEEDAGAIVPGGVPLTFETSDGTVIKWSLTFDDVHGMDRLLAQIEKAAARAGFDPIGHLSVQYTDQASGTVEQAWYDPILGEGTDVELVKRAASLRVLLLGGVHNQNGRAPSGREAREEGVARLPPVAAVAALAPPARPTPAPAPVYLMDDDEADEQPATMRL